MEQEGQRFRAVSDDGQVFIVIKYRRFAEDQDLSGTSTRELLPEYRLSDGSVVELIDAETFKITETGLVILKAR